MCESLTYAVHENQYLQGLRLNLHRGSVILARAITHEYPQLNADDTLRYVFAGSLALNLLAGASSIKECSGRRFSFDSDILKTLTSAIRKIHDIDLVAFSGSQLAASNIRVSKLDKLARAVFENDEDFDDGILSFDQYQAAPGSDSCVLSIDGHDFYISHPISMFCSKFIFALRNFGHGQSAKLSADFGRLLSIALACSDRATLLVAAQRAIDEHVPHTLNWLHTHNHVQSFCGPLKSFADELIAVHPEYPWLQQFTGPGTNRIAILRLLGKVQSGEDRQALVAFLNAHRDNLDDLLDLLNTVSSGNVLPELSDISYLLSRSVRGRDLYSILSSPGCACWVKRRSVLTELKSAASLMSEGRLLLFTMELDRSLCE